MTEPAATQLPDLDLTALQAAVPGLALTVGDHLRLSAYVLARIDRGDMPDSRAALGPLVAPLLARTEAEQRAIHDFYAGRGDAAGIPTGSGDDGVGSFDPDVTRPGGAAAVTGVRLALIVTAVLLVVAGALTLGGQFTLIAPLPPQVQEVIREQGRVEGLARWLAWLTEGVARLSTGEAPIRALLVLLPLAVAGAAMVRLGRRRAVFDAGVAAQGGASRALSPVPFRQGAVLAGPAAAQAFGRLRLRRRLPTRHLDVPRTVEAAARSGGHVTGLFRQQGSRSLGQLLLIDRRDRRDHLGALGDVLAERMRRAGVPLQAFDLLANPALAVAAGQPLAAGTRVVGIADLADQFRDDVVLVVAEAARMLDRYGRRLADWLAPLGEAGPIAVMTPRPRPSWGREERQLGRLGVAVFPLTAEGCNDYAAWRAASIGERPLPPPGVAGPPGGWTLGDAAEALASAEAEPTETVRDEADFALRAALSPRAHALLSVIAIFPVLVPDLTLRLHRLLDPADTDSAVLGELAALPPFRHGRLPFWLRRRLVAGLPPARAEAARRAIAAFQGGLQDDGLMLRSLNFTGPRDGILRFLGSLGPRAARQTAQDTLFVRFMRGDDVAEVAAEATGELTRDLRGAVRLWQAVIGMAGLAFAVGMWVGAPWLTATLLGGLAQAGAVLEPVFGRESPALQAALLGASLGLYAWVNTASGARALGADLLAGNLPWATRLLPVLPVAGLILAEAAFLALDLGYGARVAIVGAGDPFPAQRLTAALFVLLIVTGRRRTTPFDPVAFAAQRSGAQLVAGMLALAGANAALGLGLDHLILYGGLAAVLALLLGGLLVVLSAALFTLEQPTIGTQVAQTMAMACATLPLAMVVPTGVCLGWTLTPTTWWFWWIGMIVPLGLLALGPVLYRSALYRVRSLAVHMVVSVVLAAAWMAIHDASGLLAGPYLEILAASLPALAVLAVTGLVLAHHMEPGRYWRQTAILAVLTFGLLGIVAASGVMPGFAQDAAGEAKCDPADPNCLQPTGPTGNPTGQRLDAGGGPLEPIDPTEESFGTATGGERPDGAQPIVIDTTNPFAGFLGLFSDPGPFGFLTLHLSLAIAMGHWLWLRRRALERWADRTWHEGPIAVLLAVPLLLVLWIAVRIDDTSVIAVGSLYPLVAAGLAWRFGHWGAVAAIAGVLPVVGQTGIAPNTLIGGAGIGMILTVVILVRMAGERGFLARLLAIDRITPGQYAVAAVIGLPVVGYRIPEIALEVEFEAGILSVVALFIIGLSRVPLKQPLLFLAGASALTYPLALMLPASAEASLYAGFGPADPLAIAERLFWSMAVLATARALRRRTVADLGDDLLGHDGRVMALMVRVFDQPVVLALVTLWLALYASVNLYGTQISPGSAAFFTALALGVRMAGRAGNAALLWGLALGLAALGIILSVVDSYGMADVLGRTVAISRADIAPVPVMTPAGWPVIVAAFVGFGLWLASWTGGLRRPAVLSRDLWVPWQDGGVDGLRNA